MSFLCFWQMLGRRDGSYVDKDKVNYSEDSIYIFCIQIIDLSLIIQNWNRVLLNNFI